MGEGRRVYKVLMGQREKVRPLVNSSVDGKVMIILILEKLDRDTCTGITETGGGLLRLQ
jgi:hypothetical protein